MIRLPLDRPHRPRSSRRMTDEPEKLRIYNPKLSNDEPDAGDQTELEGG